ncbi:MULTISPECIES: protein translocase subunit SecF [unclassified Paenibacillus]|uniref:protein translocase subunit SecF n=1 Tax=unclassified Paenibacillus TaxID=185978 RepID=UPI002406018E|nr:MULTISPECIES: protein translocase subunit SecF [unclassified Paenibacillus]MDF9843931.1 preprotein translocase subunit SecF [Paenibacillus sp. PastF-2]MDF9850536.1 preprotein translocase subunit SecF [Paenibacillus sp. PastM-2]MDF9856262.1 preprotein translocase subunit SecF [Paenibacillus sp. PastF-1]MDH6481509.1 preprotein translocase subunit SecF [Paenibacillus sp. PastH-2]MDH6509823.1 preprotein translocase subunit SecF [Paenibacillus sp. PastM-3]
MRFNKEMDFVHWSKYFFIFSIVLTVLGVVFLGFLGLNYSVDFRAGSNVDVSLSKNLTQAELKPALDSLGIAHEPSITIGDQRVNIRYDEELDNAQSEALKTAISKLDDQASYEINTVDPEMAKELARNAIYSVLLSSLGIIIYVSIRFEWRFALAAIVALLHDAFMVVAVFSIFRLEVDITFIVAVLTIIGYSINDTIVIFDRIRENLRFGKQKTYEDLKALVNKSISQTLMRSLYTAFTVFIAAFFLLVMGGESIKMFSLAMVIGLLFGAYSSIFIASPLWLLLKKRQKPAVKNNPA